MDFPLLENTDRPVPFRFPENGSKIMPCLSGVVPPSVVGTMIGLPAALRIGLPRNWFEVPVADIRCGN